MVWPVTNCRPSRRIAMSIAWRITGSPPLASARPSAAAMPGSLWVATSLPVMSRPQADALTNQDGLAPTCAPQSPWLSLSRMSRSRVCASGMRSRDSARHISATPSGLESANSFISASTPNMGRAPAADFGYQPGRKPPDVSPMRRHRCALPRSAAARKRAPASGMPRRWRARPEFSLTGAR